MLFYKTAICLLIKKLTKVNDIFFQYAKTLFLRNATVVLYTSSQ